MPIENIPVEIREKYEIYEWKHAVAILKTDFLKEWTDIMDALSSFKLKKSFITTPGGHKSQIAEWFDVFLTSRGWVEKQFHTSVIVDDKKMDSPTHKVDCYKNRIALEIEWNNKDAFFDRDLNNFRLLFELRAISVGVIITRCDGLQEIFDSLGRGTAYGSSTTHMTKLIPRIEGGGGAGCPILVIGISQELYEED